MVEKISVEAPLVLRRGSQRRVRVAGVPGDRRPGPRVEKERVDDAEQDRGGNMDGDQRPEPGDEQRAPEEQHHAEEGRENQLVVGEQETDAGEGDDDPAALGAFEVAEDGDDEEERSGGHIGIVADIARVVEERRGDEEHEAGGQGTPAAEEASAAEEPRQPDEQDAHEGRQDAGGDVGRAEQRVDGGVGMVEEGAVAEREVGVLEQRSLHARTEKLSAWSG